MAGIFNNKAGEHTNVCPPRHIAIILDGNGRWAKKRGLPRTAGHAVGSETFRKIATYCKNIGVEYLTVYAFSTENWSRPEEEVHPATAFRCNPQWTRKPTYPNNREFR